MRGPDDYYLRRCSMERRREIKKVICPAPYRQYFANSWVVHEDLESIKLAVPGTDYIATFLNENYGTKIQEITGKSVKIMGKIGSLLE